MKARTLFNPLLCVCLLAALAQAQRVDLGLHVQTDPVAVGDVVEMEVVAVNADESVSIFSLDLALAWDPRRLTFMSITRAPDLPWIPGMTLPGAADNRPVETWHPRGRHFHVGCLMPAVEVDAPLTLFTVRFLARTTTALTVISAYEYDGQHKRWGRVFSLAAPSFADVTGERGDVAITIKPMDMESMTPAELIRRRMELARQQQEVGGETQ